MSIEEWWGRTFERRGSLDSNQMPDQKPETIQKLSTVDLLKFIKSEDDRSVRGLLCHMELRRRENWTARAAIIISILAFVVSALSAIF